MLLSSSAASAAIAASSRCLLRFRLRFGEDFAREGFSLRDSFRFSRGARPPRRHQPRQRQQRLVFGLGISLGRDDGGRFHVVLITSISHRGQRRVMRSFFDRLRVF